MQNNVMGNIELNPGLVGLSQRNLLDKEKMYLNVKRTSDIIISLLALIVLIPLIGLIGVLIKIDSKGKVFYKQKRIGKNGKSFTIYKFRTMVSDADNFDKYLSKEQLKKYKEDFKLEDDPRVTKVGKILRKMSIDELPQIINILKGDMSLIGPRPYLFREKVYMGEYYNEIIKVKPGLTGLWQTQGRSNLGFNDRLKLDTTYIENMSIKEDARILLATVPTVLSKKGAM